MIEFQVSEHLPERVTLFVDVVLPLAISKTYTYRVPNELKNKVAIGKRVIVQFGKSKIYAAIVYDISTKAPNRYEAKYILDILDDQPVITPKQLRLWDWVKEYYLCHLGEVMQAAMPAALKLASETKIIAADNSEIDRSRLSDKEYLILDALDVAGELKVGDVVKLLGQKTVFPLLKTLLNRGAILISEEIKDRYIPKKKAFLILNIDLEREEEKRILVESLNRAPKQQDAILAYFQLKKKQIHISKSELLEASGCGTSALKALIEKKVFIVEEKVVSRLYDEDAGVEASFSLSESQRIALEDIKKQFAEKDVVLLQGVTASGKTQLYIRLIEDALEKGGSVLYLLPEIALTSQIVERLRLHFGKHVGVYHSRFNDNERAEVWQKVLSGEIKVVLGARSSVFLPFNKLTAVIVDEEHETSFKQFDPAPRYHARDTAIYLGYIHQAKVLLGSATPSVETFYNAKAGKYGFVQLNERFGSAVLPTICVVNLKEDGKNKADQSYFSEVLIDEIKQALIRKEQVILFQNRRGYTSMFMCRTCGYIPKCTNCDVSLTYHKSNNKLHCHYCGFKEEPIQVCPACGSTHIENKGIGTERIEEELSVLLPEVKVGRLDLDSTRGKDSFERIITDFDEQRFNVLVGTQMVAKGLDFGKVTVIGVINADTLISYPDFRAFERSFSLLSQVSGRAGRRGLKGKVIIQAYATKHRVLEQVINHDYEGMFMTEVAERKHYSYPPFFRLIKIDIKHREQQHAHACAHRLGASLRTLFGDRVLGPEVPLIGRIRNYYIYTILLKIERDGTSINKVKNALQNALLSFETEKANKGCFVQIDVDPY
ncbi:primosomal protein N' [Olivibacter sp. SDN3]|uniref:replication restart helicase PriA n=1 Tax=Olivibacter sp. SDN3 TaxID=2764720 RepID=UPI00165151D1|nr:primosomal protein N' [Olivibacter sp. SDN3]QNL50356.1 primosomal protein N' [Olivibacter sp. SDN3]